MPVCEVCDAIATEPTAITAAEVKQAVQKGFKPRYGHEAFDDAMAGILGASFGVAPAALRAEMRKKQEAMHDNAVDAFLKSLATRSNQKQMVLCASCGRQITSCLTRRWWQFWR